MSTTSRVGIKLEVLHDRIAETSSVSCAHSSRNCLEDVAKPEVVTADLCWKSKESSTRRCC